MTCRGRRRGSREAMMSRDGLDRDERAMALPDRPQAVVAAHAQRAPREIKAVHREADHVLFADAQIGGYGAQLSRWLACARLGILVGLAWVGRLSGRQ